MTTEQTMALDVKRLSKGFGDEANRVTVLDGVDLELQRGVFKDARFTAIRQTQLELLLRGIPVIPFDASDVQAGDVIVYGDNDHVVLADGNGGYVGNSSSQQKVVQGDDYNEMGGLKPTKIIKTGGQRSLLRKWRAG